MLATSTDKIELRDYNRVRQPIKKNQQDKYGAPLEKS